MFPAIHLTSVVTAHAPDGRFVKVKFPWASHADSLNSDAWSGSIFSPPELPTTQQVAGKFPKNGVAGIMKTELPAASNHPSPLAKESLTGDCTGPRLHVRIMFTPYKLWSSFQLVGGVEAWRIPPLLRP